MKNFLGDPWCGQKASGDSIEQVCSKKLSFDDKKIELMVSNERVEDADNNASQSFYENCCEHSSNHTDSYYSEDFEKIYEKTLALQNSYKKDKKVTFKELDRCEAIHIKENDEVIDGASVLYKKEHMKLSDSLCIENRKIGTETKKDKIQKEKLKNIMQSIRENDLKLLSKKDKKLKYPCVKYYKSMGKLMRLYREIGDKNYKKYPSLRRFIIENTERKCVMDEEKWFESKLESQVNKEKHGDFRNMDRLKKNEDMRVILEKKEKVGENYKNNDEKVSSMKIKKNVEDESDMKGDSQQTESVNRKSISKSAIETTKEHKLENNVDQVDNVQNTVEDKNQLKSRMKKDSEKVDDFMVEIAENEDVIKHNDAINVLCKLEKCEMGAHKIDINTLLTFIEGDRQDEESVHKKGDFIAKSSLTKTSASEDLQGTDTKVVSMVLGDLNKKQIILEQEYLDKELQDGNLVDDTGFVTVVRKRNKHSLCEEVAQNENNQLPIENVNEKCISKSAIETTKEHKLENNVDQVDNVQNTVEDKNQLKSRMKKDSEKVDDFMVEIAENEDVIKHNDAINVLCKLEKCEMGAHKIDINTLLTFIEGDRQDEESVHKKGDFIAKSSLTKTSASEDLQGTDTKVVSMVLGDLNKKQIILEQEYLDKELQDGNLVDDTGFVTVVRKRNKHSLCEEVAQNENNQLPIENVNEKCISKSAIETTKEHKLENNVDQVDNVQNTVEDKNQLKSRMKKDSEKVDDFMVEIAENEDVIKHNDAINVLCKLEKCEMGAHKIDINTLLTFIEGDRQDEESVHKKGDFIAKSSLTKTSASEDLQGTDTKVVSMVLGDLNKKQIILEQEYLDKELQDGNLVDDTGFVTVVRKRNKHSLCEEVAQNENNQLPIENVNEKCISKSAIETTKEHKLENNVDQVDNVQNTVEDKNQLKSRMKKDSEKVDDFMVEIAENEDVIKHNDAINVLCKLEKCEMGAHKIDINTLLTFIEGDRQDEESVHKKGDFIAKSSLTKTSASEDLQGTDTKVVSMVLGDLNKKQIILEQEYLDKELQDGNLVDDTGFVTVVRKRNKHSLCEEVAQNENNQLPIENVNEKCISKSAIETTKEHKLENNVDQVDNVQNTVEDKNQLKSRMKKDSEKVDDFMVEIAENEDVIKHNDAINVLCKLEKCEMGAHKIDINTLLTFIEGDRQDEESVHKKGDFIAKSSLTKTSASEDLQGTDTKVVSMVLGDLNKKQIILEQEYLDKELQDGNLVDDTGFVTVVRKRNKHSLCEEVAQNENNQLPIENVNEKCISKSAIETTKEHKLENNVDQVDNVQNTVEDKNQLKSRMKKDSEKVDDFMVEIAENEDVIKHNDAINVLCKLEKCEMGAHKIDINTLLTFIEGDRQDEESVHKKGDFIAKSSLTKTSASEDLQGTDTKVVSMVLGDLNKKQIILEQEYLDKELQDGNLVDDTGFVTVVRKRNKHSLCEEVAQNENNQLPIENVNEKCISKSAIETTKEHKLENNVDQVDNVQNTVEDKNQLKSRMKKDSEKVDDFMVEIAENEDVIKHNDAINVLCKLEKCEMGAHKIDINTLLTFIEGDRQDEESVHKKGDFIAKSSLTKTSASEDLQGTDTKVVSMVLGDLNKKQIILEQEYLDKELQDGNLVDDTGFVTVVRKRNKHSLCEEVAQNENNQLPIENVNEKCISKSAIETTKEHKLENNVDQVDNVQNTVEDKNQLKSRMKKDSEKVDDFMVEIAENEDVIKHNDAINVLCKLEKCEMGAHKIDINTLLTFIEGDRQDEESVHKKGDFIAKSSLTKTSASEDLQGTDTKVVSMVLGDLNKKQIILEQEYLDKELQDGNLVDDTGFVTVVRKRNKHSLCEEVAQNENNQLPIENVNEKCISKSAIETTKEHKLENNVDQVDNVQNTVEDKNQLKSRMKKDSEKVDDFMVEIAENEDVIKHNDAINVLCKLEKCEMGAHKIDINTLLTFIEGDRQDEECVHKKGDFIAKSSLTKTSASEDLQGTDTKVVSMVLGDLNKKQIILEQEYLDKELQDGNLVDDTGFVTVVRKRNKHSLCEEVAQNENNQLPIENVNEKCISKSAIETTKEHKLENNVDQVDNVQNTVEDKNQLKSRMKKDSEKVDDFMVEIAENEDVIKHNDAINVLCKLEKCEMGAHKIDINTLLTFIEGDRQDEESVHKKGDFIAKSSLTKTSASEDLQGTDTKVVSMVLGDLNKKQIILEQEYLNKELQDGNLVDDTGFVTVVRKRNKHSLCEEVAQNENNQLPIENVNEKCISKSAIETTKEHKLENNVDQVDNVQNTVEDKNQLKSRMKKDSEKVDDFMVEIAENEDVIKHNDAINVLCKLEKCEMGAHKIDINTLLTFIEGDRQDEESVHKKGDFIAKSSLTKTSASEDLQGTDTKVVSMVLGDLNKKQIILEQEYLDKELQDGNLVDDTGFVTVVRKRNKHSLCEEVAQNENNQLPIENVNEKCISKSAIETTKEHKLENNVDQVDNVQNTVEDKNQLKSRMKKDSEKVDDFMVEIAENEDVIKHNDAINVLCKLEKCEMGAHKIDINTLLTFIEGDRQDEESVHKKGDFIAKSSLTKTSASEDLQGTDTKVVSMVLGDLNKKQIILEQEYLDKELQDGNLVDDTGFVTVVRKRNKHSLCEEVAQNENNQLPIENVNEKCISKSAIETTKEHKLENNVDQVDNVQNTVEDKNQLKSRMKKDSEKVDDFMVEIAENEDVIKHNDAINVLCKLEKCEMGAHKIDINTLLTFIEGDRQDEESVHKKGDFIAKSSLTKTSASEDLQGTDTKVVSMVLGDLNKKQIILEQEYLDKELQDGNLVDDTGFVTVVRKRNKHSLCEEVAQNENNQLPIENVNEKCISKSAIETTKEHKLENNVDQVDNVQNTVEDKNQLKSRMKKDSEKVDDFMVEIAENEDVIKHNDAINVLCKLEKCEMGAHKIDINTLLTFIEGDRQDEESVHKKGDFIAKSSLTKTSASEDLQGTDTKVVSMVLGDLNKKQIILEQEYLDKELQDGNLVDDTGFVTVVRKRNKHSLCEEVAQNENNQLPIENVNEKCISKSAIETTKEHKLENNVDQVDNVQNTVEDKNQLKSRMKKDSEKVDDFMVEIAENEDVIKHNDAINVLCKLDNFLNLDPRLLNLSNDIFPNESQDNIPPSHFFVQNSSLNLTNTVHHSHEYSIQSSRFEPQTDRHIELLLISQNQNVFSTSSESVSLISFTVSDTIINASSSFVSSHKCCHNIENISTPDRLVSKLSSTTKSDPLSKINFTSNSSTIKHRIQSIEKVETINKAKKRKKKKSKSSKSSVSTVATIVQPESQTTKKRGFNQIRLAMIRLAKEDPSKKKEKLLMVEEPQDVVPKYHHFSHQHHHSHLPSVNHPVYPLPHYHINHQTKTL